MGSRGSSAVDQGLVGTLGGLAGRYICRTRAACDLEPYRNRKPKVTSKQRKRTRHEIIAVSSDLT
eukprot:scaffold373_cov350-Pavlova_lutheri.AAC.44